MSISLVQQMTSGDFTNTGTFGSPVTAGNTILFAASAYTTSNITITSSSPLLGGSTPSGAALLTHNQGIDSNNVYESIRILPNIPGGATTLSITFTNGFAVGIVAYEVAGLGASPIVDKTNSGNGNGSTASSGTTGSVTKTPEFVIGAAVAYSLAFADPGSPWTSTTTGASGYSWASYQIGSGAGSYNYVISSGNGTEDWAAAIATVAPTGASSPSVSSGLLLTSFI